MSEDLAYLLSGSLTEKVTWSQEKTMYGGPVQGGRRTIAHLEWTDTKAREQFGGPGLVVIQSAYNTGVAASAGTHDRDGCLDVTIPDVDWWDQQRFFRSHGWAAWYRYPPTFGYHIHMISLGCPGPLGEYVPGQISDYYNHKTGLVGHYADNSWHPADIKATIFDYNAWKASLEDDMPYTEKELTVIMRKAVAAEVDPLKAVMKVFRQNTRDTLKAIMAECKDDATKKQLNGLITRMEESGDLAPSPAEGVTA